MSTARSAHLSPRPNRARTVRRRRNRLILLAVCLLVASGLSWGGYTLAQTCGGLHSGVRSIGGQCVGVTDGRFVFESRYRKVEGLIRKQNKQAAQDPHAVTVALLEPLTVRDNSVLDPDQMLHILEGAYTAQLRANTTDDIGGGRHPAVRLVLANEGSSEGQWRHVVDQLNGMRNDRAPLLAVTGMGVSLGETAQAAEQLSKDHLAMVGSLVTADYFAAHDIAGFVRVEPDDRTTTQALADYLARHRDLHTAVTVYDSNDSEDDLYAASLLKDLSALPHLRIAATRGYAGASGTSSTDADLFNYTTNTVCSANANLVLYAGRLVDLRPFLRSLAKRPCATPVTVATAGTDLGGLEPRGLAAQHITVVNASATDGAGWSAGTSPRPPHYADFQRHFPFPVTDLRDGDAISVHDSVFTAVDAIRTAYTAGGQGRTLDSRTAADQLYNLNANDSVPAASGELSFSREDRGEPKGNAVTVVEIPRGGSS